MTRSVPTLKIAQHLTTFISHHRVPLLLDQMAENRKCSKRGLRDQSERQCPHRQQYTDASPNFEDPLVCTDRPGRKSIT